MGKNDPHIQRDSFGDFLKLRVFGASHGPSVGMRLENFPSGFRVDMAGLQEFLDRRAPGRDGLSSRRSEPDVPEFLAGLREDCTTGGAIEAIIPNLDARPGEYGGGENAIPRPGHADYTQWIQTGRIPTGGGMHSGRMTAPLCIAGGICRQWLEGRGVSITGRLLSAGGNSLCPEEAISEAAKAGDSVGGIVEVVTRGLPPGLGGPLFQGLESKLASAAFAVPGVKGFEIGDGFGMAGMRGSEANDPFCLKDGHPALQSNRHGGLLGGITTGMPLVFRVAMKPTPSIFLEQRSVDLVESCEAVKRVQGRHDPCIARRAVPVLEAMAAFVLADAILADEVARPRICLTLTESSLEADFAVLKANFPFVEMCELRADCLSEEERGRASKFPSQAGMPVVLTVRRKTDGGCWEASEEERAALFARLLDAGETPFDYVDFEDDFRNAELEKIALERGVRIIRSLHDFRGPVADIVGHARRMKGDTNEIPKIAFAVHHCSELAQFYRETADFQEFPHIFCAMGAMGQSSRILAGRTHSMLTYASSRESLERMAQIGHLTPLKLVRDYGFRQIFEDTELYAVTGWPLGHTLSPELNNEAFSQEGWPAVMVPLPAETAEEALDCAKALGVRGIAVTVPHKKEMLPLMDSLSAEAVSVGAVNTVLRRAGGWHGANTDVAGFREALLDFLHCGDLRGWRVAILGAGGAASAVACAVAQLGGEACVFNRTVEKGRMLAEKYGFRSAPLDVESRGVLAEYRQIMIQCTSAGLSSRRDLGAAADPIPFYQFQGDEKLFDLIYSPAETHLMARARAAGCLAENGLPMLLAQAREQRRLYRELALR